MTTDAAAASSFCLQVAVTGASGNIANHLLFMVRAMGHSHTNPCIPRGYDSATACAVCTNPAMCYILGHTKMLMFTQLASGEVYGKDQPIALMLLGSERSYAALEGVAMELEDSLYPLLREVCWGEVKGNQVQGMGFGLHVFVGWRQ